MIACRACAATALEPILDLGSLPLANALLASAADVATERRFPLTVVFCPRCSLVQIQENVPPVELFSDYPYFSSCSSTMVAHARALAAELVTSRRLGPGSRVVEIASNDGYLLQWYLAAGIAALGVEPAANVAAAARARGVPTEVAFFDDAVAARLVARDGVADVVHAHNVLAHVPDLAGFLGGIRRLLGPGGVAVVEVPYVRDLVERVEFDTIYHEHLCYFSLTALARAFAAAGLHVVGAERVAIHGGSLRVHAVRAGAAPVAPQVYELLAEEEAIGLLDLAHYRSFAGRVSALGVALGALLRRLRAEGHRVAAYGAAAKGATLLNSFGLGADVLDFVVDRSPHKQGHLMPGVHLPIRSPAALLSEMPDYTLLLAWNFADEILEQQHEYRARGGRFIVPVPEPRILR